jgi:hypothetical protein
MIKALNDLLPVNLPVLLYLVIGFAFYLLRVFQNCRIWGPFQQRVLLEADQWYG